MRTALAFFSQAVVQKWLPVPSVDAQRASAKSPYFIAVRQRNARNVHDGSVIAIVCTRSSGKGFGGRGDDDEGLLGMIGIQVESKRSILLGLGVGLSHNRWLVVATTIDHLSEANHALRQYLSPS